MLNIKISDEKFHIKNIDKSSIRNIYSIYRNSHEFKYATGIFHEINYDQFSAQISQFIQRENVFFLDIYLDTGEFIGLIKGIVAKKDGIVWINSMIINTPYQGRGFGQRIISLLETYLKRCGINKVFLSVYKNNIPGISFWKKCSFANYNGYYKNQCVNINSSVQIMYKLI